jgi:YidC/Oxa1 family membrane protein insertase
MENIWFLFVGVLQTSLFVLAQAYGGNISLAILTLSFVVRLALLPVTLRVARRNYRQQTRLKGIEPELQRLKIRYRKDPEKLSQKTMELYKKKDIRPIDGLGFLGNLIQLPIFAGLFSAIKQGIGDGGKFLWIADISQPNILLTIGIAVLTMISSALSPSIQPHGRAFFIVLPALLTLAFMWKLSAGLGLYWAASSLVGVFQAAILRLRPS